MGPIDRVAIGYSPANGPDRVLANWVMMLLAQLDQQNAYAKLDMSKPIDDAAITLPTSVSPAAVPGASAGEPERMTGKRFPNSMK